MARRHHRAENAHSSNKQNQPINIEDYRQKKSIILIPKTRTQERYIDLLTDPDSTIIFATGPAGTGKTMLAVLSALRALKEGSCKKIVITRPAVGVDDEKHGFLPGSLNQKMEPWTRPIFDYMKEYLKPEEIARMLDEQIVEISPLAFMRGRTFKNSWIIADEMQNATPEQMKMLLTRLGENSRMVITGDTRQADRRTNENGLLNFKHLVESQQKDLKYITGVEFARRDIQRHPAVEEILELYGEI